MTNWRDAAREALRRVPAIDLGHYPTPVEELRRLRGAIGGPRLLVKRDDAIAFAFGGNKVRKLELVAARAAAEGADTLVTAGGVQSNHARVTAAAAAKLGLGCVLVANGAKPDRPTANALLDALLGAEVHYVRSREERAPAVRAIVERLRQEGRRPFEIPIGASTPLGALAFARAVGELAAQGPAPDVIIHSTSSGGTQAGLLAGCAIFGLPTRVLGISADEPVAVLAPIVSTLAEGAFELLGVAPGDRPSLPVPAIDTGFVGQGYGIPTAASRDAIELAARTEAIFLDPTYTAKAMAGLIAHVRRGTFRDDDTVLFWHTGGQVGLFIDD